MQQNTEEEPKKEALSEGDSHIRKGVLISILKCKIIANNMLLLFFLGLFLLCFSTVITILRLRTWRCFKYTSFFNIAFPNI